MTHIYYIYIDEENKTGFNSNSVDIAPVTTTFSSVWALLLTVSRLPGYTVSRIMRRTLTNVLLATDKLTVTDRSDDSRIDTYDTLSVSSRPRARSSARSSMNVSRSCTAPNTVRDPLVIAFVDWKPSTDNYIYRANSQRCKLDRIESKCPDMISLTTLSLPSKSTVEPAVNNTLQSNLNRPIKWRRVT